VTTPNRSRRCSRRTASKETAMTNEDRVRITKQATVPLPRSGALAGASSLCASGKEERCHD